MLPSQQKIFWPSAAASAEENIKMQALNIFHVLIAIAMVAFVLVQRGPGATAGAAFGSGASGTVFGARGAGSFLSRTTWVLAALFCLISLTMAVIVTRTVVTPETDLGVVGTEQVADDVAVDPTVLPGVDSLGLDSPGVDSPGAGQDSDLPELDTSSAVQSQGDLPQLEEETETVSVPEG